MNNINLVCVESISFSMLPLLKGIKNVKADDIIAQFLTPITRAMSQSQAALLDKSFSDNDLSIDIHYTGQLTETMCALLLLCRVEMSVNKIARTVIDSMLDEAVEKHESVEDKNWQWFGRNIGEDTRNINKPRFTLRYFVITTTQKYKEQETTITTLAYTDADNVNYLPAAVAQSLSHGYFDENTFGIPCFENDGLITYPANDNEIDIFQVEALTELTGLPLKCHPSNIDDIDEQAIDFIAYQAA